MNFLKIAAGSLLVLGVTGCSCYDSNKPVQPKNKELSQAAVTVPKFTKSAVAIVSGLQEDKIKGKINFTQQQGGVLIVADIEGLTPGKHGFHIHEHGVCEGDGSSAGAHFNPEDKQHGAPTSVNRHLGDLGNLVADEKGHAHYERLDRVINLNGKETIVGRSIIIHADPDDYTTQPTGASGARIACGLIE